MKKNVINLVLLSVLFILNSSLSLAQNPNSWTQKSNFGSTERYGAIGFSIGTKGYFGTGWTTLRTVDFWEYDPATDVWTQKADFGGSARVFATGFSIGTKGYVGCGEDMISITKDFWEYDPTANSWTQKADVGVLGRKGAVGYSIGNKGFIGTGLIDESTRVKDFWEYDPTTDTWTQKADVGGPVRAYAAAFSLGSKGYVGTGNSGSLEKDFWEYDPITDIWTQKADFAGLARFGGLGLSIGAFGYIGLGDAGIAYTNDFWEYNPATDNWTNIADSVGVIRTASSGFTIGYKGYFGTGKDGAVNTNDFWEYTPTCIPPVITAEPASQSIDYGTSASYSVTATYAVSYQWQEDSGAGFADITDGGIYSNATTNTLDISLAAVDMTGYKYRCIITGPCMLTSTTDGNATLTVASLEIVITPAAGQTKEYGSADPAPFTYTYLPALTGTDVITGLLSRVAGENAGEYIFELGTLSAGVNYNLSVAPTPTFSISTKALTITADNQVKCADGVVFGGVYSLTYNGFIAGEDSTDLGGAIVIGGDAVTAISDGNYTIEPSGLTSSNYNISFLNGILVIKPTPATPVITRSGDTLISDATTGNQWFKDGLQTDVVQHRQTQFQLLMFQSAKLVPHYLMFIQIQVTAYLTSNLKLQANHCIILKYTTVLVLWFGNRMMQSLMETTLKLLNSMVKNRDYTL